MQHIKMLCMGIACIALFFAGASSAFAQALDNTWFQIDISAKGTALDEDDGSTDELKIKTTAYLHIWWNGSGYGYIILSERAPDDWQAPDPGAFPLITATEDIVFMIPQGWPVYSPDGTAIAVTLAGQFKVKLDKSGNLQKAGFTALGPVSSSLLDPENELAFAKIKVKAKMIDVEKLPFTPPPM